MTELTYDQTLFDRRFLNCFQRQAMVFLQKAGAPVSALTGAAYVSTDRLLAEVLCEQAPKYDFANACLSSGSLALVGWEQQVTTQDSFARARPALTMAVADTGFAILTGSVFYFAHTPEYRDAHLNHSIVVTACDTAAGWEIFDDDPRTVLRRYRYPEQAVADFFDNNGTRQLRSFRRVAQPGPAAVTSAAADSFGDRLRAHTDSGVLLTEIAGIVDCRWRHPARTARHLRDCFLLLSGSRELTGHFLGAVLGDSRGALLCADIAGQARRLAERMMKAEHAARFDTPRLSASCAKLWALDRTLSAHLLQVAAVSA